MERHRYLKILNCKSKVKSYMLIIKREEKNTPLRDRFLPKINRALKSIREDKKKGMAI